MDAAGTVVITDVVLAEAVWTLAGRKYRLTKAELVRVLEGLFNDTNIRFEDEQVVWHALQAYRNAVPADGTDFTDALIVFKALRAASHSSESLGGVYSFDTAMRRLLHTASP